MEFCQGGNLADFIEQNEKLSEKQSQIWFSHLVQGLKVLYEHEIIHRDLKTENVLLSQRDFSATLQLVDFGLSKKMKLGRATTGVGTPLYSAPEILQLKDQYSRKIDMWSLGMILYQMLFGRVIFYQAETLMDLLRLQPESHKIIEDSLKEC